MFRRRSREEQPVDNDMLTLLADRWHITQHGIAIGCWVYVLHQADGAPFRVGQSASWNSRLHEHICNYRGRLHHYSLIPCRDEQQMDVRELLLIDEYEAQGIVNLAGTAEIEALRRRVRLSAGGAGLSGKEFRELKRKTG